MGAKSEYDARKTERERRSAQGPQSEDERTVAEAMDMFDRLVTSIERVADILEIREMRKK